MAAARRNIVIEQGATFELAFQALKTGAGDVFDATGYTFRGQVRMTPSTGADGAPLLSFTVTPINLATGQVEFSIPASATGALVINPRLGGRAYYDIEMESPSGKVTRLMEGEAELRPQVTR